MTLLSINLNKVALVRNSRGGSYPSVIEAARIAIDAGVRGITVHPRVDARHITLDDVVELANFPAVQRGEVELNVEADLRQEIIDLVSVTKPTQYTIVPGSPGELTSTRGWRPYDDQERLRDVVKRLGSQCRLSVFCDPAVPAVKFVQQKGLHAVELNTRIYAELWALGQHAPHVEEIRKAAEAARQAGMRVNGGHDLTTGNLPDLLAKVRFDELSIGHHLIGEALLVGLKPIAGEYLKIVGAVTQQN